MPTTTEAIQTPRAENFPTADERALRILAKSVYRELRSSGHTRSDVVGFTNELLSLVSSDMRNES